MRIATWNLERPNTRQNDKITAIKARLKQINADIWILTETNACVSLGPDYYSVQSEPMKGPERYSPGENRTTIWSRFPIKRQVQTHDPETAVCAEIESSGQRMLIYGTVLPYHAAGTKYPYRSRGETVSGKKTWQLHYDSIASHAEEWRRIRLEHPFHPLVIGGDLNQNRDGRRWYGTKHGRQQLGLALAGADLVCATEVTVNTEDGETLTPCIDHICMDQGLQKRVAKIIGWTAGSTETGRRVSDHNGVCVVLTDQLPVPSKS